MSLSHGGITLTTNHSTKSVVLGSWQSHPPLQHMPHNALHLQRNLRFCCAIKFAPCGLRNLTLKSHITALQLVLFLQLGSKVWPIRAGVKRWNERSQDGGPIDLNVISAILRQPHLLRRSVVGSKLSSPRYSQSHPPLSLLSTHKRSRSR